MSWGKKLEEVADTCPLKAPHPLSSRVSWTQVLSTCCVVGRYSRNQPFLNGCPLLIGVGYSSMSPPNSCAPHCVAAAALSSSGYNISRIYPDI